MTLTTVSLHHVIFSFCSEALDEVVGRMIAENPITTTDPKNAVPLNSSPMTLAAQKQAKQARAAVLDAKQRSLAFLSGPDFFIQ